MEWPISWNDVKNSTPVILDLTELAGMNIVFSKTSLPMDNSMANQLADIVVNKQPIILCWVGDINNTHKYTWFVPLFMNSQVLTLDGAAESSVYTGFYRGKAYQIYLDFTENTIRGESVDVVTFS